MWALARDPAGYTVAGISEVTDYITLNLHNSHTHTMYDSSRSLPATSYSIDPFNHQTICTNLSLQLPVRLDDQSVRFCSAPEPAPSPRPIRILLPVFFNFLSREKESQTDRKNERKKPPLYVPKC